jgi:5'-deoxynucleotidase YfbR-like HD superfamily hydrolase
MLNGESSMKDTQKEAEVILTASGAGLCLDDLDNADINLYDISYGLSHVTRWSGQFGKCTVARHSALVTYLVAGMLDKSLDENHRTRVLRYALMHDASEAYLGEVSVYIKRRLPEYKQLEARLMSVIHARIGIEAISAEAEHVVAVADTMSTIIERMAYHTLKLGTKPQLVKTANGDYATAYAKRKNDILFANIAYKGLHAACPAGKTWESRIPSWEWWLVDLFGAFGL